MGVQDALQQSQIQVVCILGHTDRYIGHCHTWNNQERLPRQRESDKNILTLKNKRYGTGRKIQVVQFRRSA